MNSDDVIRPCLSQTSQEWFLVLIYAFRSSLSVSQGIPESLPSLNVSLDHLDMKIIYLNSSAMDCLSDPRGSILVVKSIFDSDYS